MATRPCPSWQGLVFTAPRRKCTGKIFTSNGGLGGKKKNNWAMSPSQTKSSMRAALLLVALCAPAAFSADLFGQWKVRHGKTYTSVEE